MNLQNELENFRGGEFQRENANMDNLVAVLDASALLAYIKGEPGSELVEKIGIDIKFIR